jgi:2-polyprenyl-3-methyl-5-hydroxy-6-metoxy-1,4-benzoquinol methylase
MRLNPIPTEVELNNYYSKKYYDLANERYRAPQLKRFMQGGKTSATEKAWYASTLWTDVNDVLARLVKRKKPRLLDVGAGTGFFAHYMQKAGWHVIGVEPSIQAAQKARRGGVEVYSSISEFLNCQKNTKFDAISLLSVLEHVPNPRKTLQELLPLLSKGGLLVIQVPNDFSVLQQIAQNNLKTRPWWLAIPDHIHYFDWNSLNRFLKSLNLRIVEALGDFPMEFFLLWGESYIGNPDVGSDCHRKRVRFERTLPKEIRRNIYRALASVGVGRNCLAFAQLSK